jgi:hypothetical protein
MPAQQTQLKQAGHRMNQKKIEQENEKKVDFRIL